LILPPAILTYVRAYLEARTDRSPWLWLSHPTVGFRDLATTPPRRLTLMTANEAWDRIARDAHVASFTSHQLRHTSCTQLLADDIPAASIVQHMGWSNFKELTTYGQVDAAHRQDVVDVMDKLATRHQPAKRAPKWAVPPTAPAAPSVPPAIPLSPLAEPDDWSTVAGAL